MVTIDYSQIKIYLVIREDNFPEPTLSQLLREGF